MQLDHEKLDVYRVSLDFAVWAYEISREPKGSDRHARDQLLRASQSIPLNIAEGCGKISPADRARFFPIASGSARECAAVIDILLRCKVVGEDAAAAAKQLLVRIVSMLTRMIERGSQVREEDATGYGNVNENGYGAGIGQPLPGGDV
jgi:four helix bundle protein